MLSGMVVTYSSSSLVLISHTHLEETDEVSDGVSGEVVSPDEVLVTDYAIICAAALVALACGILVQAIIACCYFFDAPT